MTPYIVLAQLYADNSRADLAYSALPNAPVQPVRERRRRIRRFAAWRRQPQPVTERRPVHVACPSAS